MCPRFFRGYCFLRVRTMNRQVLLYVLLGIALVITVIRAVSEEDLMLLVYNILLSVCIVISRGKNTRL